METKIRPIRQPARGTDFNDLHVSEGLDVVAEQLEAGVNAARRKKNKSAPRVLNETEIYAMDCCELQLRELYRRAEVLEKELGLNKNVGVICLVRIMTAGE